MEMAGVPVRLLESETPFTEVHFAGDARSDHPLEGAVHRRSANPRIGPPHDVRQIVSAQMTLLTQEDADDPVPLVGAFAAGANEVRRVGRDWRDAFHVKLVSRRTHQLTFYLFGGEGTAAP